MTNTAKKIITRKLIALEKPVEVNPEYFKGQQIEKEGKTFQFFQYIPESVPNKCRLTFVALKDSSLPLSNANVNWNFVFELSVDEWYKVSKYPELLVWKTERVYKAKKVIPYIKKEKTHVLSN